MNSRRDKSFIGYLLCQPKFPLCIPATDQYTPVASARYLFCIGSKAKDPVVRDRAFAGTRSSDLPHFEALFRSLLPQPTPSSRLVSRPCRAYSAGSGKASIRRSMLLPFLANGKDGKANHGGQRRMDRCLRNWFGELSMWQARQGRQQIARLFHQDCWFFRHKGCLSFVICLRSDTIPWNRCRKRRFRPKAISRQIIAKTDNYQETRAHES